MSTDSVVPTPAAENPIVGKDYLDTMDKATLDRIIQTSRDNTGEGELKFSRMAILQPQSPEITKRSPGYQQGMIVDNRTRVVLSQYSQAPWLLASGVPANELPSVNWMLYIPIIKLPAEYIKWKKRQTEGIGMWWKTLDPGDARVRAGCYPPVGYYGKKPEHKGVAPPVTDNTNYFGLVAKVDVATDSANPLKKVWTNPSLVGGPFVTTFAKTSKGTGQMLTQLLEQHTNTRNQPFWAAPQFIYTKMEEEGTNTWYEYKVAIGPMLNVLGEEFKRFIHDMASSIAIPMSDDTPAESDGEGKSITKGRFMQELVLNSAKFEEEGDGEEEPDLEEVERQMAAQAAGTAGTPGVDPLDVPSTPAAKPSSKNPF
jgi:hypothetical protein